MHGIIFCLFGRFSFIYISLLGGSVSGVILFVCLVLFCGLFILIWFLESDNDCHQFQILLKLIKLTGLMR